MVLGWRRRMVGSPSGFRTEAKRPARPRMLSTKAKPPKGGAASRRAPKAHGRLERDGVQRLTRAFQALVRGKRRPKAREGEPRRSSGGGTLVPPQGSTSEARSAGQGAAAPRRLCPVGLAIRALGLARL